MAFTKSTVSTTSISDLPNKPLISPTALKAKFDEYGANDKPYINGLIDELEKNTATSGAENIGSRTITGITGNTVWSQLQSLYNLVVSVVLGQIPDGSITNPKLGSDIKIGSNAALQTSVKTEIVSAVNEINAIAKSSSFKNKIFNGNFNVNQLVKSGTVTLAAGEYGHDMWKAGASGCVYTFSTSGNVQTITILSGSLLQIIEGNNLQVGTYVLSWTGTSQGKIASGSFSSSGVTSAVAGGSNTTIEFNTGTLGLVQFEIGSVPTNFEFRQFQTELTLCQRYFEKSYAHSQSPGTVQASESVIGGIQTTYETYNQTFRFLVEKRAVPTVVYYNTQNGTSGQFSEYSTFGSAFVANKVMATAFGGTKSVAFTLNGNGTVGNSARFHWTADARL